MLTGETGAGKSLLVDALGLLPKKEKEPQKTADQDAEEIAPV